MAAMEECPVHIQHEEEKCNEKDVDSGVDNSSDSGSSVDDGGNTVFSSTYSLDCDPIVKPINESSDTVQQFLDSEHKIKVDIKDLPPSCPHKRRISEISEESIAVLEVDQPSLLEPNVGMDDMNVDQMPEYFQNFKEGYRVPVNFDVSQDVKPPWLDEEKFKRGQKFARDHFFCINFAEMVSLFLIFAVKSALAPLIYTGKSSTPFTAFQRYLSTCNRLVSWYSGDPWCKDSDSYKNMSTVKKLHKNIANRLMNTTDEDIINRGTMGNEKLPTVWCTSRPMLLEDFRSTCPVPLTSLNFSLRGRVWLNQADMAATQFAFVGIAVAFPKEFGIHRATEEDLDDFVYLWRCLGYLHGIEDKYNFCYGTLAEVQERAKAFIDHALKPSLRNVDSDWEHMCRCLVQGIAFYMPGVDFEVSLTYLCHSLKIHMPRLTKNLSIWQSAMYRITKFVFGTVLRIPGMLALNNMMVRRNIRRAKEASPETLEKWEKTEFPYMKKKLEAPVDVV